MKRLDSLVFALIVAVIVAVCAPSASLRAQNGILTQNAGFETGVIAPWRVAGSMRQLRVDRVETCASGARTAAFGVNLPPASEVSLAQNVFLPTVDLQIDVDALFVFGGAFSFVATIEVSLASRVVKTWRPTGQFRSGWRLATRYSEPIRALRPGPQELRVTVRYQESAGRQVRLHLDNLVLRPRQLPLVHSPLCPFVRTQGQIWTSGSSKVLTALWVAPRLGAALRHPRFRGTWQLDRSSMVLLGVRSSAALGGSSAFAMPSVAASLVGRSFALQALEIDPKRGIYSFGLPATRRIAF